MKTILRWLVSAGVLLGAGWVGQAQPVTPPVATTSYSRGLLTKTNAEDARNWLGLSGTNGAVSSTNMSVYGTLTVSGNTNIVANGSNGLVTAAAVRILTNYPVASNSLVWSDWVKAWVSGATTGQNMVTNNAGSLTLAGAWSGSVTLKDGTSEGTWSREGDTTALLDFTLGDYTARQTQTNWQFGLPLVGNASGLTNFSREALAASGVVTNNGGNYTLSGTMGGPSASFGIYNGNGSGLTALPAAEVVGNLTAVSNVTAAGTFTGNGSNLTNLSAGTAVVTDYGAAGNGIADDTAAIQSAIAARSVVYFPPGTYKVSTLYPTNGQWLRGAGPASVLIPAGTNWLVNCLSNSVNVSDMLLDGRVTTANRSLAALGTTHGLRAWVGGDVWIRDVAIRNCDGYGIFVTGITVDSTHPDRGLLSGLSVSNCYWGLRTDTAKTAEYLRFNNCLVSQCYVGAQLQSPNSTFANNRITDNTIGFWVAPWTDNRSHTLVTANTFNHNTYNLVGTNCGTGITIVGNNLLGNGTNLFSTCTNLLIAGNSMDQFQTVFDRCGPAVMTANYMLNSMDIVVTNSPLVMVTENRDNTGTIQGYPYLTQRGEYYTTQSTNGSASRLLGVTTANKLNIGDVDGTLGGLQLIEAGNVVATVTNYNVGLRTNLPQAALHILNTATPLRFSRASREDWSVNQTSTSGGGLGIYNETDTAYRLFLSEAGDVTIGGSATGSNFVAAGGIFAKSNSLPTGATLYATCGGPGSGVWSYTNALLGFVVNGATNVTWKVLVP